MIRKKIGALTPAKLILGGFLLIILAGTLLLMLPASTRGESSASFTRALFTATSATCVTGLILQDTYTYWSEFGQAVILMLIQTGGMGVVTVAIAISLFSGKKIGLKQRFVMQESISAPQVGGIVRLTGFIVKATLIFEGIGALVMAFQFCPEFGFGKGIWFSIFHSVSAFCNAGFDLMGERALCSSLTGYMGNALINITIMLLIVTGGIGFFVWNDIKNNRLRFSRYHLQTKIVLATTGFLIAVPALFFFFFEFGGQGWENLTLKERILASLFQSVTPRTAGFNTVDLTKLNVPSQLLTTCLMITGGSPGSTAGGIKTTTFAMLFLCIRSTFHNQEYIECFNRRIPFDILRNAVAIFTLYFSLFLGVSFAISYLDGVPLGAATFEAASAIGTVGLSLGITGSLSTLSQFLLISLMYFGRVGGLTMIYALTTHQHKCPALLPQEKITVG